MDEYPRRQRHSSSETLKSQLVLDSPDSTRINRQRFSDAPSESTDNSWATAISQHNVINNNNIGNNIFSTDDDTITVNRLSHPQSPESEPYLDETPPRNSATSKSRIKDYSSRRKAMSPISPPAGSVSSTNMWDELEAIKRRLQHLELSRLGATGDRPQTRGTTNSSSSPQRSSPFPSAPSQAGTSITSTSSPPSYPLLNAAITKVKASGLPIDIAQAIEATAQEAISLALMTNHDHSTHPPSPRSVRKKVDGVCRGLTEVCLALADHQQSSQRQQTRAAQHRAEDAQDSSPLSATARQSMTLSRTTARRLSGASTVSRARRPAHSVVGIPGNEDLEDDGISVVSRPGISRFSTMQYRPPSRAATEVFRDTTPPVPSIQRFSTNRRSLLSRHAPSLSDYHVPTTTTMTTTSDHDSQPEEERPPPLPRTTGLIRSSTFAARPLDNRRRSLNTSTYFSSPPRNRTENSRDSSFPTPPNRPVSLISPPRVNVAATQSPTDRRDSTVRRRPAGSVVGEKMYATDNDDDIRSTTLGQSALTRKSMAANDRRHASITQTRYGSGRED
jgi:hypothetical protein